MEFKINIISEDEDFALKQVKNLKNWIENDEELENVKIKQERQELQEDDAGGGLLAVLGIVLGSPFEQIAKTIQVWIQEKTKRTTKELNLEFEQKDGTKFKINSKNIGKDEHEFVNELVNRFKGNKSYNYTITTT